MEFGLDLRVIDMHADAIMNIVFDLENNEDFHEVLQAIGAPSVRIV